jgi:trk system potassium uptake protein TrkH
VATFAALVLVGTGILRLCVCQTAGQIGLLDALFPATSAVCVTGLITHDTATELSRVGRTVILILIYLGGLGVVTFSALAFQLLHRQVSLQLGTAVQELLLQGDHQAGRGLDGSGEGTGLGAIRRSGVSCGGNPSNSACIRILS